MEASTYAWAVIISFFVFYAAIQLRKCFLQLLSSGERNTSTNRLSESSIYTIENDSTVRSLRNDQDLLCSNKKKDDNDLPTYEEVIASENMNSISNLSSSTSQIPSVSEVSEGTSSSNVTACNATINR